MILSCYHKRLKRHLILITFPALYIKIAFKKFAAIYTPLKVYHSSVGLLFLDLIASGL